MGTKGSFGYKIGKKIRLMNVYFDADLLWQICVREIYVLMKHYGSLDLLKTAFENLNEAKNKPKQETIEKCKIFTDLTISNESKNDWYCLTRFCQHSFINILESGYFFNNGDESGLVFILDFNTSLVRFYKKEIDKKVKEYEKATIEEIMEFDDMPTKTYTEIINETRERFEKYNENLEKVKEELKKIEEILYKAKRISDHNIIGKAQKLWDEMDWERKKIEMDYRYFYHRMDALNLIDHSK
jgi:hypothetical protein